MRLSEGRLRAHAPPLTSTPILRSEARLLPLVLIARLEAGYEDSSANWNGIAFSGSAGFGCGSGVSLQRATGESVVLHVAVPLELTFASEGRKPMYASEAKREHQSVGIKQGALRGLGDQRAGLVGHSTPWNQLEATEPTA